jgi:cytosine/adenosine deaminase-related metal-dependent hydrolase
VRLQGGRITSLGEPPSPGDLVVELNGDRLLPGLINAHDHLQFNHFPALTYPHFYRNAAEWIEDFNRRLRGRAEIRAGETAPRARRFLAGGIKNLLSGVTTVAHHDPLVPELLSPTFPTRVLERFGWAHSLGLDGEEAVRRSRASTDRDRPWIIHAAEGIDAAAAAEFDQLEALGCIQLNTLLVHAVALSSVQRRRLADAGGGMIWCPTSNLRLFGRPAAAGELLARGRVALGTDSRLTGARDLLEELRVARDCAGLTDEALERLVTCDSARLLCLPDAGILQPGARADLIVLPRGLPLWQASRADLRLVMLAGAWCYGDGDYVRALGGDATLTEVAVDGYPKAMHRDLAACLLDGGVTEPGVSWRPAAGRAACG